MVILCGEADLAVSVGCCTEDFVSGTLDWPSYFKTLLTIGSRFGLMHNYRGHCFITRTLMNALRYALNVYEPQTRSGTKSFVLKSLALKHNPSATAALKYCNRYCILFVDSLVSSNCDQPQLPFTVTLENEIIFFNEVDCSPVFEGIGNDRHSLVSSVVASYNDPAYFFTAMDSIVVEVDAWNAMKVRLPRTVRNSALSQCSTCFGYTANGLRCKNMRRPLRPSSSSNATVWCNHHHDQEREFKRFLVTGKRRRDHCLWWEQYEYEELVMCGSKIWT
eukprot:gene9429-10414_t